jgi:hypothetical protein
VAGNGGRIFRAAFVAEGSSRMVCLYVHVLQPTVHFELDRVWKREILARLKKRFGSRVVREVRFRIG